MFIRVKVHVLQSRSSASCRRGFSGDRLLAGVVGNCRRCHLDWLVLLTFPQQIGIKRSSCPVAFESYRARTGPVP